jgi:hypothetical protein
LEPSGSHFLVDALLHKLAKASAAVPRWLLVSRMMPFRPSPLSSSFSSSIAARARARASEGACSETQPLQMLQVQSTAVLHCPLPAILVLNFDQSSRGVLRQELLILLASLVNVDQEMIAALNVRQSSIARLELIIQQRLGCQSSRDALLVGTRLALLWLVNHLLLVSGRTRSDTAIALGSDFGLA